jgi:predicted RNA-binding Zn-ribbon protein involved in translation (DUF1610 family)
MIGLAILPAVIWASVAFIARSSSGFASKLRIAWSARTKQELIAAARSFALYELLVFFFVLVSVVVWACARGPYQLLKVLSPNHWDRAVLLGIVSGLALIGLLLILRVFFPEARKFSLLVLAGIASPPLVRVSVLLLVVSTEELWRAVCLKSMMAGGVPGPQALIATSIAYSIAYLALGVTPAISEGIVGAAFGGLFLWSDSFLVPLTAHAILQGQVLLYALAAAPDAEPGAMNRRPFTRCPACGARLNLQQVNLNVNAAFFCPNCRVRLTSSDRRRGLFRWGLAVVSTGLLFTLWVLFPDLMLVTNSLIVILVMLCIWFGLVSILQVIFPPKFEFGDPDFVGLDLKDHRAVQSDEEKAKEIGPDSE